ncbi:hypothetical protein BJAS_P3036 [Bathymodiolus japonicus methanotrophic gill symbiont]|uniref:hypothetical protein n=1 Tax=Bathymodiolus japonicus methanotrophic gill symbiont TaxID=113269 RepID=UPI001B3F7945|nr:hypothetical protein [Bathymodiolus japonicus methanotrophic gill symbiont]GFO72636.1 hypothetical protein BJAS_P3036 [Bathymodiolus japonicus methanotrophic gill symbiont]
MNWITQNTKYLNISALALLMALTRSDHFGSAISLPDASLAVFYLAGIFLGGITSLLLLCVEAGLLDYIAIAHWQVSDYCISPAYIFLIPTYAVMFFAGRWSAKYSSLNSLNLVRQLAYLLVAVSIAFLISNGSFYLLSGKFPDLSLVQYAERVAKYYPAYVGSTLIYSLGVLVFTWLMQMLYPEAYKTA